MRLIFLTAVLLAAVAAACGGGSAAGEAAATRLTITVWPEGRAAGGARQWSLRCAPVGGTHPSRVKACARIAAVQNPFRPTPRDQACTQIYGGPEEARITGVFRGWKIDARFARNDGCQIARWDRIRVLFPVGAGT
ncbi:MAG: SSI family serine proteinase inhibitor [Gaiellaceae bacterium]